MAECEVKRIQQNSAQAAADRATADLTAARQAYVSCLGPAAQGDAAVAAAAADMRTAETDAAQLLYVHEFVARHMERTAASRGTLDNLGAIVSEEAKRMESEVDQLKSQIRNSRRIFLDSAPQTSPAVGGLYFTKVPDNQVLIAFITCFGALLLFIGIAFGLNMEPFRSLVTMSNAERWKTVAGAWVGIAIVTYIAFWLFT